MADEAYLPEPTAEQMERRMEYLRTREPQESIVTKQARTIESQAARIEAVLALHQKDPAFTKCQHCEFHWPCPTRRALTEDTP